MLSILGRGTAVIARLPLPAYRDGSAAGPAEDLAFQHATHES